MLRSLKRRGLKRNTAGPRVQCVSCMVTVESRLVHRSYGLSTKKRRRFFDTTFYCLVRKRTTATHDCCENHVDTPRTYERQSAFEVMS